MRSNTRLAWIVGAALLTVSTMALAQHGPQQRPQGNKPGPAQMEQNLDRSRMQGRDRMDQQDRQNTRDQAGTMAQDEARAMGRDQQRDRDTYGYQLMTEQEHNEYREQLEKAETNQERQQIMAEHRAEMQARAKEQGVDLEEPEESE